MKIKKIYTALISLALLSASCETLDYAAPDSITDDSFWQTEEQAKESIISAYAAARAPYAFGMEFTYDMISDIADGISPWQPLKMGNSTSQSSQYQNVWQYCYELVHRANVTIRNVKSMIERGVVSPESVNPIIGEAKFLRAMTYFRLMNCWGDVPYYDESWNMNESFAETTLAPIPEEQVRARIIEDLDEAISKLPVSWSSSDRGRATKGAAYALRGKVYLFNKQYEQAIPDFEEIIYNKSNDYGYQLHPDYESLFRCYNGATSPEFIFSWQSVDGGTSGYALDIVSYFGNKSTMRLIASNLIVPSVEFVDSYQNLDGSKFSWDDYFPGYSSMSPDQRRKILGVNIDAGSSYIISLENCDTTEVKDVYRNRDPRLNSTVITLYSHYLGTDAGSTPRDKWHIITSVDSEGRQMEAQSFISNSSNWDSYFWRKWIPTGNLDGYWVEYNRTPYEFPLIRLGDVILMLAECYNETGNLNGAITEVNKIRKRAGMPELNSGASWMAVKGKDDMVRRIRDERKWELAGEGQRYWDLRRWGMLDTAYKDAYDILGDFMYSSDYQSRFQSWPYPLNELDRNPNLIQKADW